MDDSNMIIGDICCGMLSDSELVDVVNTTTPDTKDDPTPEVMPRGRTVADRCDRCFMVPASNGACGCDQ